MFFDQNFQNVQTLFLENFLDYQALERKKLSHMKIKQLTQEKFEIPILMNHGPWLSKNYRIILKRTMQWNSSTILKQLNTTQKFSKKSLNL